LTGELREDAGREVAGLTDAVTTSGVFETVLEGYDAVYDVLSESPTFNQIWRTNAYGGDFPIEFAHIGFLTLPEARQVLNGLHVGAGDTLVDVACGTGGPGLWMAKESGASLIGIDPSPAGVAEATRRAQDTGLADRATYAIGTFEQTGLDDGTASAVISIEAFQYAPDKRAALAELHRILVPGGRFAFVCFEVDPTKAEGLPVLGVDPVPDYRPGLEAAGFEVETYEETPGWQERVDAAFGGIVEAGNELVEEMGQRAAASALAEAMLTVQMRPYPRRVLAVARRGRGD
jgi:SAM-dependent methyltransferase